MSELHDLQTPLKLAKHQYKKSRASLQQHKAAVVYFDTRCNDLQNQRRAMKGQIHKLKRQHEQLYKFRPTVVLPNNLQEYQAKRKVAWLELEIEYQKVMATDHLAQEPTIFESAHNQR